MQIQSLLVLNKARWTRNKRHTKRSTINIPFLLERKYLNCVTILDPDFQELKGFV